jgi:uncharacterized membrane protein
MNFQFTHPYWLLLLVPAVGWVVWLFLKSDVQIGAGRRWTAFILRLAIVLALILALAGLQYLRPQEGMNVIYLLDRSDSVPPDQLELAREYVMSASKSMRRGDRSGVIAFGADAGIEFGPTPLVDLPKMYAVVETERTDIAGAIRLGTALFPEHGQKRLVLLSDGNENLGDAAVALMAARQLEVTLDVIPLNTGGGVDVSVQRVSLPSEIKEGQTFEVKIFVQADEAQRGKVRLFRNDQLLGEQEVDLSEGKNLLSFPQTLDEPGFYSYDVALEAPRDMIPQNNRASAFTTVRGEPRILIVSSDTEADLHLAEALRASRLETELTDIGGFPATLGEIQSYESIFLCNVAAGDLGRERMALLESAVRDFGVGLVAVGGDESFAAGGYRNTPLEAALPVDMELSSKKVLPRGALVLIMHGMEFNQGNQISRDIAIGTLETLGPQDEMGVLLWDGREDWLFELTQVGDKRALARQIAGMNQGDLPSFENLMSMAHQGLKNSTANLKHIIVFSDGDPAPPSQALMDAIVADRITVSAILIAGHFGPEIMMFIAEQGRGRFYHVTNPADLPQAFIKETAVILKSAIVEDPFKPQMVHSSEPVRGIGPDEMPMLLGYVASTAKDRAEVPLLSDKGDPILAHWQYGLGRAVAFTSDARPKWGREWVTWEKYRQFWSQVAQWSMRRVDSTDLISEFSVEQGEGQITVEALDPEGNYRNFLDLEAVVVGPKGDRQTVRIEQTGPGFYEANFPTRHLGAYVVQVRDMHQGQLRGSQVLGASINYSPEFNATRPNLNLLHRLTAIGQGRTIDPENPADHPFLHGRRKTFQPRDLWEWLLMAAIILFPLDVGVRRIQLDREEWSKVVARIRRLLLFWQPAPRPESAEDPLSALLARRDQVRSARTQAQGEPAPELFQPSQRFESSQGTATFAPPKARAAAAAETEKTVETDSTTSKLLAAKKRAQRRMD